MIENVIKEYQYIWSYINIQLNLQQNFCFISLIYLFIYLFLQAKKRQRAAINTTNVAPVPWVGSVEKVVCLWFCFDCWGIKAETVSFFYQFYQRIKHYALNGTQIQIVHQCPWWQTWINGVILKVEVIVAVFSTVQKTENRAVIQL